MKTHSIPANTGPDSLWRQAERANAGGLSLAERIAAALDADLFHQLGNEHDCIVTESGIVLAPGFFERDWTAIVDRKIREATGCG